MDIENVKENLKKENCSLIVTLKYGNANFVKALESHENGFSYRYFQIKEDNTLKEVKDELLLAYLKENNEIHEDREY